MASSVQGTVPDQTWGQNLPGYFKDNVKPFVHGTSFLIPHDNPTVPNIVNKSTVGMVNDRGFIDAPVPRKDTVRAYIENPSSYVARLHPHDMTSGMGGVENLSNLYNFGHPTPVVNGEDYNDTLYWARGETARERKDPLSAGYAQQVLGPDGAALMEQMKQDQARQYMKEKYRQGLTQAAFEGSATVTAQEREMATQAYDREMQSYNEKLAAWRQRYEAFISDPTNNPDDFDEVEDPMPEEPQAPDFNDSAGDGDAQMEGAMGPVRGGRVAAAGMSREPTVMARNVAETYLVNFINGSWVQPPSAMYSNALLTTNAGRYRQFNPRIAAPDGVRSAFANGGTGWGGGATSQIQAATDAQRMQFMGRGRTAFAANAEVGFNARATAQDVTGVRNNVYHDGSVLDPTEQAQLGAAAFTRPQAGVRPEAPSTPARAVAATADAPSLAANAGGGAGAGVSLSPGARIVDTLGQMAGLDFYNLRTNRPPQGTYRGMQGP
jgi:hypothetical protein